MRELGLVFGPLLVIGAVLIVLGLASLPPALPRRTPGRAMRDQMWADLGCTCLYCRADARAGRADA